MLAARMYGYKQPLVIEDVKTPEIAANEVLVKVSAAGICRTDFQLVDGYFREYMELPFPAILGHEIVGTVDKIGSLVPRESGLTDGDQVVVSGGWGDGSCRMCLVGNTNICARGNMTDLTEIVRLAEQGKIRYTVKPIKLEEINENLELLGAGEIVGRAVVVF